MRDIPFTVVAGTRRVKAITHDAESAARMVLGLLGLERAALTGVYINNPAPYAEAAFGAPMGRQSARLDPDGVWQTDEMALDKGGYDAGGAYWGLRPDGAGLFAVQDGRGNIAYTDAPDAAAAARLAQPTQS